MSVELYETKWWSLDIPEEWDVELEDDVTVISDEDGVSEIGISTLIKADGETDDDDVEAFSADLIERGISGVDGDCGEYPATCFEYLDDGFACRDWFICCGPILMLISYACDESNKGMDDAAISEILASLRLYPEAVSESDDD
ncbi:hypothetical protein EDC56_1370 [Sinobacterium caligoides]|uniref:Uncharacterized protein n=1 Tax=Sinobacterium caligoides TaxID=933926 RepID=A0A3N2E160_9GAMM|nr:hypothetical protein [Sinobacterium caligoides]ROS05816.1 hypothetical protein EDC56_1370 [Sinobacterium caligoides]